jgi:hypothetical protein
MATGLNKRKVLSTEGKYKVIRFETENWGEKQRYRQT